MAEFAKAQPQLQRLLHKGAPSAGQTRKRSLLGPPSAGLRYVRERQSSAAEEALQAAQERQGSAERGVDCPGEPE